MSLEWDVSYDGRMFFALSGRVTVGFVREEHDGRWSWCLDALMKDHIRTQGRRPTKLHAMKSLETAWLKWLAVAHLRFVEPSHRWKEQQPRRRLEPANDP